MAGIRPPKKTDLTEVLADLEGDDSELEDEFSHGFLDSLNTAKIKGKMELDKV